MQTLTSRKATPVAQTREALRILYKTDLYVLARDVLYKGAAIPITPEFHKPVCNFLQTTPYADNLVMLSRDSYKCFSRRYWQEVSGRLLTGMTADGRIVPVNAVMEPGPRAPIVRVTTTSGRAVDVTRNHPFLGWLGTWRSVKDGLGVGDWVGIVRRSSSFGAGNSPPLAMLVGWMLADSSIRHQSITAYDALERAQIVQLARLAGFSATAVDDCRDKRVNIRGMRSLWRAWGLWGAKSADKFVPAWIFHQNESTVRAFLRGLFHDASDKTGNGRGAVTYVTTSRRLAYDVHHLVTKFGLHAKVIRLVAPRDSGAMPKGYVHYRVVFTDTAALFLDKPAELAGPSVTDVFPPAWRARLTASDLATLKRAGIRVDNTYRTTREKVRRAAECLGDAELRAWCDSDIGWEQIVAVEDLGEDEIVPIETSAHTLAVGDIVTHNTGLLTVSSAIQDILINPEVRILIATNTGEYADKILSELTGHIFNNEMLHWLYPEIFHTDPKKYERNTRSDVTVKRKGHPKESTVTATGVGGDLTGQHFDRGKIDDVVSKENSRSKIMRQEVTEWVRVTRSLFEPHSKRLYTGTPWAFDDAWMWLVEQKFRKGYPLGIYRVPCWQVKWRKNIGEYLVDERGRRLPDQFVTRPDGSLIPAFPERFTTQYFEEVRKFKGDSEFAAQYLLDPMDAETTVFPRQKVIILPRDRMPRPESLWCAMSFDPALSQMGWADYSAFAVGGFDQDNRLYILDLQRGRWTVDECVERIYRSYNRYPGHIRALGIDAQGFQRLYMREFTRAGEKRRQFLPVTRLERNSSQKSKSDYIRPLESLWNNGELILAADLPALDDFLDEAERFRLDRESTHDDMLDAVADLLQLRVRPVPTDPHPEISRLDDPQEQAMVRYMVGVQERRAANQQEALDDASLRMAWLTHKRNNEGKEAEYAQSLGLVEDALWS